MVSSAEQLHTKGTDRLLGALDCTRYDTVEKAMEALKTLPGLYECGVETSTDYNDRSEVTKITFAVRALHSHTKANAHLERGGDLHETVCKVLESYRTNPLGSDPFLELEAVCEKPKPITAKVNLIGGTNDATQTLLNPVLPLVKLGNGPQSVEPDKQACQAASVNEKSVGGAQ